MGAPVYRLAGRHAGFPPVRAIEPGRCGECWDACPRLSAGEPFDFACAGCGDCCRQRRDLVLSGFDLYRIARRLRLSPRIVAAAFCKSYIAPESCLPALRLTPDPKTGNCRFFEGSACAIHAARPLACALYPLGQSIDTETGSCRVLCPDPAVRRTDGGGAHPSGLSERCRCYRAGGHRRAVGCCVYPAFPTAAGGGRAGKSPLCGCCQTH